MMAPPPGDRSAFARRFARVYAGVLLPAVYRRFILTDAYRPHRRSLVTGLSGYGPTDVELRLDDPILLKWDELQNRSDIDPDDAADYHPIATVFQSPQFLAIGKSDEEGPVFLWHHETGAFRLEFQTFEDFRRALRPSTSGRSEANP
jgi:hypothetical protein